MNKKKNIIFTIVIAILLIAGIVLFNLLNDETRLTTNEKQWLTNNTSTVQSINVINNVEILGKNGKGIFYDFIKDLEMEYNITINPITYNANEVTSNKAFKLKDKVNKDDLVFYEEHYVLISKTFVNVNSIKDIMNSKIGCLDNDLNRINKYIKVINDIKGFKTYDEVYKALVDDEINYMILPQQQYLDYILKNDYQIVYHFSDLKNYFVYDVKDDDTFNKIIKKFYIKWMESRYEKSLSRNMLNTYIDNLSISTKELSSMQANVYEYGFINNSPYEVIMSGNYGGIISEYLKSFSKFTNIEFNFRKYNSIREFNNAINKKDINLYFNYYNLKNDYKNLDTTINLNYNIIAPSKDSMTVKSLQSLNGKVVYVLADSKLKSYLEKIDGIIIKTYQNEKELRKIAKKGNIIAIDEQNFKYYYTNLLSNYLVRFSENTNINYGFKVNSTDEFSRLFSKYISTLDSDKVINDGLYNHEVTLSKGSIMGNVAKYTLLTFCALFMLFMIMYKSSKKVKIATKIKKEEKIKYIDQLTSLKNRNYLSENINNWNKNTIYPQATIVVDLNNLQEINDTLGYEHGDNQIKAAANILIKTQLDNSDIIRTDGNEFLIYLIGYSEKQIVSYIRKLYKEFKTMPYEHGAAIGYSMITDDLKSLEDAINESVEDMRTKKEEILED